MPRKNMGITNQSLDSKNLKEIRGNSLVILVRKIHAN